MAVGLRHSLFGYRILKLVGIKHGALERKLNKAGVLLAYFTTPNVAALGVVDLPTINTVLDLGHRDLPEFVEISGDRHFEEREFYYRNVLPKSFRVVVDTERTSDLIQSLYGVFPNRIVIGGLQPVPPVSSQDGSDSEPQYFLYPAQFWPHKRHVLLLKAFKSVCDADPDCRLVLTGSDKGNLEYVKQVASQLQIKSRVDFKGFVGKDDLNTLVRGALAIVFPSELGPSNLPPIEAALLGVPSLISRVHSDQMLQHPLIQVVKSQNAKEWATEMIQLLHRPKRNVGHFELPPSQLVPNLLESITEFAEIRDEWSSEPTKQFRRRK
jgi:glycosyltransferase involved in cell wall biosynthesis